MDSFKNLNQKEIIKAIKENNTYSSILKSLCPNCHSLTENFGSRNTNCTRIDRRVR